MLDWIPACAGMTWEAGNDGEAGTVIPAKAGIQSKNKLLIKRQAMGTTAAFPATPAK